MRIGILVFDDVEVLDACGPFEVFSVANRLAGKAGRPAPFEVLLIADGPPGLVRARGGLPLQVGLGIAEAPALDLLLVPGGVTDAVEADPEVVGWVTERARDTPYVASVCTGAFVLARAGVITDQRVTTHWDDLAALRSRWPSLEVVEDVRWVHASSAVRSGGQVYTSAGISAGIDLALHLVEVLVDRDTALGTARLMDYAWAE
ncbi:DJ-1/PfpI family protein [Nocardioides sp.]|uniref:DJ-1/PfpI family protein n=1 Tax=Nocardioides sp. TaxID=35761 RepID=UPI0023943624|nr:DJ-1/PfpI family protein [Nocardioides sp.]MDE0778800.1 DJ-1/PfpI family protein [Nocardioides sp.]